MMSASTRRELHKLRELVSFLLQGAGATPHEYENLSDSWGPLCCYFCQKRLTLEFAAHGNATGPKLLEKITVHHVDGDHSNNDHVNKALAHRSCHKGFHRRQANLARAAKPSEVKS